MDYCTRNPHYGNLATEAAYDLNLEEEVGVSDEDYGSVIREIMSSQKY